MSSMNIENEILINEVRRKMEGVDIFNKINASDKYILRFLDSTEFDVDEAFKRMKSYHEHIQECPGMYPICGPLDKKTLIERRVDTMLPYCDREGRTIYLQKVGNMSSGSNTSSYSDVLEETDMWFEYILCKNPEVAKRGLCVICDMKDHGYGFIRWMSIKNVMMSMKKTANQPFNDMKIHVVNKSFCIQFGVKVIFPLLPEASKKNIFFHLTNWKSLHKHIDPSCLPEEYGGYVKIDYESIYTDFYRTHEEIVKSYRDIRYEIIK